jgi:hypothetical protein
MKIVISFIFCSGMVFTLYAQQWSGNNNTTDAISRTGSVGIGTSSPQGPLQVNQVRPIIFKNNGGNGIYGSEIGFNAVLNTSVVPNQFKKLGGTGQYGGASMAVDYSGNILFQMYNAETEMESTINFNPQIAFLNNGNLGLGTSSPLGKVQIFNSLAYNANETATSQDHILLNANDPGNGGYFGGITWESSGRRRASIVATREHSDADYVGIAFFTKGPDGPGSMSESMRISRDGNVGIGTINPDAKLAVKGSIHTQEVRVDLTGAVTPDYVFEKDYNLLSLSELETYINQNKHLPEVPSAKEMEADGLNLKEMNLLLLKKVEELTLHLIEMNKKYDVQGEKIGNLESKLKTIKP